MEAYLQGNLFRHPIQTKEEKIIREVCRHFGVDKYYLIGYSNKPEHSDPRRVCWWLLYKWCRVRHDDIAALFSNRNRTTVLHGIDYVNGLRKADELYSDLITLDAICEELN